MAITRKEIIDDIELRLSKGKPSDDLDIVRRQIAYWIDLERDLMVQEKLSDIVGPRGDKGNIDPFYIKDDLCLEPAKLADTCSDCPRKDRFHITLTRDVMWLPGDRGIVRITDDRGVNLTYTTEKNIETMRSLPFAAPTKQKQVAYREERNIFIEVISEVGIDFFEYDVYYIPKAEGQGISDTADYPLEEELVPELTERVLVKALRQQGEGVGDLENDGTDPSQYGSSQ